MKWRVLVNAERYFWKSGWQFELASLTPNSAKTRPLYPLYDLRPCFLLLLHNFWATITSNGSPYVIGPLTVLSVLYLSVTVYCRQTVGWIKMPLGTEVGRGPGDIVLNGDQLPHGKRHSSLHFLAHVYCGWTVAHLSYSWALVLSAIRPVALSTRAKQPRWRHLVIIPQATVAGWKQRSHVDAD